MRVLSVVGARPNFMELAPVVRALVRRGDIEHIIVHTGQHDDPAMSDALFEERPITCRLGTNRLVAARRDAILAAARDGAEARARPRVPIER